MHANSLEKRVHLDHAATSPLTPEAFAAMEPWLRPGLAANASSLHAGGRAARAAVDEARAELAAALSRHEDEVLFTGSGTEADNLALRGLIHAAEGRPHLVVSAIEHEAVLRTARWLEHRGDCSLTVVPPESDGRVRAEAVLAALRPETALVSLMAVNNQTGVLQPVEQLGRALAERGVPFHCDAVQAPGRLRVDGDLVSYSAHKYGGPAGVGVLVVRRGLKLQPVLTGGGQEEGLRPGTESVAQICGAARALRIALEAEPDAALAGRLEAGLRDLAGSEIAGGDAARAPGLLTVAFQGAEGSALLQALDLRGFAVSTGSACSSGSAAASHVLRAMGWSEERARSAIRVSLGPGNDDRDLERLLESLTEVLDAVRREVRSSNHEGRTA